MHDYHKYYIFGGITVAIFMVFLSVTLAITRTSSTSRAAAPQSQFIISRENSYVFASPVSAASDGVTPVRITVFLLNNQGLGVEAQKVILGVPSTITVSGVQDVTDSFGRAIFDLTSKDPGSYTISASASQISLPQSVSISFR
jgi:hypothetical protein